MVHPRLLRLGLAVAALGTPAAHAVVFLGKGEPAPTRGRFARGSSFADPKALALEAGHDERALERYRRRFKIGRKAVVRYLRGLHAGRLARTRSYVVYSMDEAGGEAVRTETLWAGLWVFRDRAGEPVLLPDGDPIEATLSTDVLADEAGATVFQTSAGEPSGTGSSLPVLTTLIPFSMGYVIGGGRDSVPEPAPGALLGLAALGVVRRTRRVRSKRSSAPQ